MAGLTPPGTGGLVLGNGKLERARTRTDSSRVVETIRQM